MCVDPTIQTHIKNVYDNYFKLFIENINTNTSLTFICKLINDFILFKKKYTDLYKKEEEHSNNFDKRCPFLYRFLKQIFTCNHSSLIDILSLLFTIDIEDLIQTNNIDIQTLVLVYSISYSNHTNILDYAYEKYLSLLKERSCPKLIYSNNNNPYEGEIEEYIPFDMNNLYNKKHYNTIKWLFSKKEFFMIYKEVTPIYKLTQPLRRPSIVLYQSYETYSKQIKDLLKKDNLNISLE